MRKILIPVFALLFLSSVTFANDEDNKRQAKPKRVTMHERLNLTEEQKAQIAEIRMNGGGRTEIQAVLTEEQRAQLPNQGKGMKSRHGGEKHGNKGKARTSKTELDAAEEQEVEEMTENESDDTDSGPE